MSDHVRGKNIRYQEIVEAGFCYVGQKEICPKQGDPSCQNGSHACYRCWTTRNIRAMHGCYTKRNKVCKTRSPDFEHFPERDPPDDDVNDNDYDVVSVGASRRPGFQASRRPLFDQNDVMGPSHGRQDSCSTDHFQESKRPCNQTSEGCKEQLEKESLQTRVVQLEGEMKLLQQQLHFKDETHKLHTDNLERVIAEKKEELETVRSQNSTLQAENIKIKLEKETQEEKQSGQLKQYEHQIAQLRQDMAHENSQNKLIIDRLTQQRPQLGSNGLFNGQIFSNPPRVPCKYYTCKFEGCRREFSQEEKDSGVFNQHLFNAHGVGKENYVNPGFNNARGPSGYSSGSRSGNGLLNFMPGSNGRGMSFPVSSSGRRPQRNLF